MGAIAYKVFAVILSVQNLPKRGKLGTAGEIRDVRKAAASFGGRSDLEKSLKDRTIGKGRRKNARLGERQTDTSFLDGVTTKKRLSPNATSIITMSI